MEEKLSLPSDGEDACAVLNPNAFTTPGTEPPPLSHPAQRIPVLHSPRQQWVVLPKAPQLLGHEASLRVPPWGGSEGGIEPVTARARWGGSGKQLSFTTARSITAGGEGLSRCFKNSQQYF